MKSPINKDEANIILQLMDKVPVPGSSQRRIVSMIENKLIAFVQDYDKKVAEEKAAAEEKDEDGDNVSGPAEQGADRPE